MSDRKLAICGIIFAILFVVFAVGQIQGWIPVLDEPLVDFRFEFRMEIDERNLDEEH